MVFIPRYFHNIFYVNLLWTAVRKYCYICSIPDIHSRWQMKFLVSFPVVRSWVLANTIPQTPCFQMGRDCQSVEVDDKFGIKERDNRTKEDMTFVCRILRCYKVPVGRLGEIQRMTKLSRLQTVRSWGRRSYKNNRVFLCHFFGSMESCWHERMSSLDWKRDSEEWASADFSSDPDLFCAFVWEHLLPWMTSSVPCLRTAFGPMEGIRTPRSCHWMH